MAVTITVLDLATELRASDGAANLVEPQLGIFTRLLSAVTSLVEDYAPDAPADVQNEAVIRCAAWRYDAVPGRSQANPLDLSGARALLSAYRVRRAIPVTGDDTPAGMSPGESASIAAIQEAIEAHRAMSNAHHEPGATGTVVANGDGLLPGPDVAMRMGWTLETVAATDVTFLRDGNHPDDGATEGTTAGLDAPPIPPTLATDEQYRFHVWIAGVIPLAALTSEYGDQWLQYMTNEGALTVDGVVGILYSEIFERHNTDGISNFNGTIPGDRIATRPWVTEQIAAIDPGAPVAPVEPVDPPAALPSNPTDGQMTTFDTASGLWVAQDIPTELPQNPADGQLAKFDAASGVWIPATQPDVLKTPIPALAEVTAADLYRTAESVDYRRNTPATKSRFYAENLGGGRYGFSLAGGATWSAGGKWLPDTPDGLVEFYFDDRLRYVTDGSGPLTGFGGQQINVTIQRFGSSDAAIEYRLARSGTDNYNESFAALDPASIFADGVVYEVTFQPTIATDPVDINSGSQVEKLLDRFSLLELEGFIRARIRAAIAALPASSGAFSPVTLSNTGGETVGANYGDLGTNTTWNTYSWLILDWGPTAIVNAAYVGSATWVRVAKLIGLTGTRTHGTSPTAAANGQYILIKSFLPTPRTVEEEGLILSWDNSGGSRNGRLLIAKAGGEDVQAWPLYLFGL